VTGTRFKIYLPGFAEPQTILVKGRPGTIAAGPRGRGIRVVDARHIDGTRAGNKPPYKDEFTGLSRTRPPWRGDAHAPAQPIRGHFDKARVGSRAFTAAAAYATVRSVLDLWERIFGHPLPWFFRESYRHLEVIPRVDSKNSWSGEGFIECGFARPRRERRPMGENFDVVAHETGHLILKTVIGNPVDDQKTLVYRAHEEGAADLVALVAAMYFDGVLERVLDATRGKLWTPNALSRIGESRTPRIPGARRLFNQRQLKSRDLEKAWREYDKHTYALPWTGALYDIFNVFYHDRLAQIGVVVAPGAARTTRDRLAKTQDQFPASFARDRALFVRAACQARDDFARLLATYWQATSPQGFSYERAALNVLGADRVLRDGRHGAVIRELFVWRRIYI